MDDKAHPLTKLNPEELKLFRKTEHIKDRICLAMLREFIDDTGEKRITEEDVIVGFRDFKKSFEEFMPHLF